MIIAGLFILVIVKQILRSKNAWGLMLRVVMAIFAMILFL